MSDHTLLLGGAERKHTRVRGACDCGSRAIPARSCVALLSRMVGWPAAIRKELTDEQLGAMIEHLKASLETQAPKARS
jgi:hypothetical protein